MRLALLASALTAGVMWLALGGAPAQSQKEEKSATCQTCGQGSSCPHCQGYPHHGWQGMHKWEYKCVHQSERPNKKAAEAMTEQFNGLAEDGWRLAKADDGFWCFHRIRSSQ
ncbi:MAG: hypothetical protein OEV36_04955 [Myxococcales bacterium]|nr:hypothetical protein [Myxococcales bacterium]